MNRSDLQNDQIWHLQPYNDVVKTCEMDVNSNSITPQNICTIWDAILAWRFHISKSHLKDCTKSTYLTSMLKTIELEIINVNTSLEGIEEHLKESTEKINQITTWSAQTKSVRKSSLSSLLNFITSSLEKKIEPSQRPPQPNEIRYVLSNVLDQSLTVTLSPEKIYFELSKINQRDAHIVWVMMHTRLPLEAVLDLKKINLVGNGLFYFNSNDELIPVSVRAYGILKKYSQISQVYIFETANGKRIRRTQVMRTLKLAGRQMGLNFDLTPKVLHRYVNAYMDAECQATLEKILLS